MTTKIAAVPFLLTLLLAVPGFPQGVLTDDEKPSKREAEPAPDPARERFSSIDYTATTESGCVEEAESCVADVHVEQGKREARCRKIESEQFRSQCYFYAAEEAKQWMRKCDSALAQCTLRANKEADRKERTVRMGDKPTCELPEYPQPPSEWKVPLEQVVLPWCSSRETFQVRSLALMAALYRCAASSIGAGHAEEFDLAESRVRNTCQRIEAINRAFNDAPESEWLCRCPPDMTGNGR